MYLALWRLIPGPLWVRVLVVVALVALVLTALVLWVFPFVDYLTSPQDVIVEG